MTHSVQPYPYRTQVGAGRKLRLREPLKEPRNSWLKLRSISCLCRIIPPTARHISLILRLCVISPHTRALKSLIVKSLMKASHTERSPLSNSRSFSVRPPCPEGPALRPPWRLPCSIRRWPRRALGMLGDGPANHLASKPRLQAPQQHVLAGGRRHRQTKPAHEPLAQPAEYAPRKVRSPSLARRASRAAPPPHRSGVPSIQHAHAVRREK